MKSKQFLLAVAVAIGILAVASGLFLYMKPANSSKAVNVSTAVTAPSQNFANPQNQVTMPSVCLNVALDKMPAGWNINWLFQHHSEFKYKLYKYPENRTIVWIISGPSKQALEVLVSHILQMECAIEHGQIPREFDPLFKVDAIISSKYIHLKIKWINDTTVEIIKTADNDCAWQVMLLHAQIVQGFFTQGRLEAQQIHQVPEEALKVCAPYLNQTQA